ncbi:RIP metalloprotease RseP [Pseudoteredinibacter isoporae]|uniref:Zinc metalloprotease n=1 Tax=Pseudoteredinibacter isoporae TaxID=570281 RepID=A0A7X0JUC4_9GAMM|nr:RIP metalloprotease RseP [Pseudoteredinibacter isoporae]MBB6522322.1 regulator of sigma E protease [Pseudoteredinibacter isoporae]NHO87855.1 RIP metalloprotease RseP [Pseudoteredinibacter isoporae]NIB23814.1 RIP metalloprotease RseP [Pseudoteredinibacter isoporae]
MSLIQTIFWFILALGVLVTIHEFGHYYVARRCGIKVLRFSVGFGKVLYSWRNKEGTEFAVAALPLGGYVKMLDEREGEVAEHEKHLAFTQKPVLSRIAVVVAGPLANFILAVLLYWFLTLQGHNELSAVVGKVEPGSIAAEAGLEPGQRILAVDGQPTPTRKMLYQQLLSRLGESGEIHFRVQYPGSNLTYESVAELDKWLSGTADPHPVSGLGMTLFYPPTRLELHRVQPEGPAAKAGLKEGDKLIAVDGEKIIDWEFWVSYIQGRANQAISLSYERDGRLLESYITPDEVTLEDGRRVGRVGTVNAREPWPKEMIIKREYGFVQSFVVAVDETWEQSKFVLVSLKKLIVGQISTKNLSGPLTIAKVAGDSAKAGWQQYISLLALLSVFLGVMNLLPIPVLDGGHLLYYVIELVKGSPLPERVQLWGYQIGMVMVLGIMAVALYNDVVRLF